MKKYFTISILIFGLFSGQQFENFPPTQDAYEGGKKQFYKDFNQSILNQGLKPCENNREFYNLSLVIYPDRKIKYVKDEDTVNIERNKCAFELARNGVKHLKGWKPAEIDGKKVPAITFFTIVPKDLFQNFKKDYDASELNKAAEYKGGIAKFRNDVVRNIDLTRFNFTKKVRVIIRFVVGVDGKIDEVKLEQPSGLKEFDEMLISSVYKTKKWTPAMVSGINVRSHYKLPITFNTH